MWTSILTAALLAVPQSPTDQLFADNAGSNDQYGLTTVVMGKDVAFVGAEKHDGGATNSGAVYVYEREGMSWPQTARLEPSDPVQGGYFGQSLALAGERLIVGAPRTGQGGSDLGKVYVFRRQGVNWVQETTYLGSDTQAGDDFASAVAFDGDFAVVGAPTDSHSVDDAGSVYVFQRVSSGGWIQHAKLVAPAPLVNAEFGASVAISGDFLVVGSPFDQFSGTGSGAAYAYRRLDDVWVQEALLGPNDPQGLDEFGHAVALDGDYAIVGAPRNDDFGGSTGAAYVYRRVGTSWQQQTKLLPTSLSAGDQFGFSVSIYGDYALSGARQDDFAANNAGSAFVFLRNGNTWVPDLQLLAWDPHGNDNFGRAVALGPGFAIGSAPLHDGEANNAGSAYTFLIDDGDCDDDGIDDATAIASGASLDCNANGRPDECDLDLGISTDFNADAIPDDCQPLAVDVGTISMQAGGEQTLTLTATEDQAKHLYLVLGSVSGTQPGLFLDDGQLLPLNYDWYLELSASKPNAPPFVETVGFLDEAGAGFAGISFPPGSPAPLVGLTADHVFLAVDFFTEEVELISNTTPLELVP